MIKKSTTVALVALSLILTSCASNKEKTTNDKISTPNKMEMSMDGHAHALGDGTQSEVDGFKLAILSGNAKTKEEFDLRLAVYKGENTVNNMVTTHEEKMHLILVDEYLSEYLHLHPKLNEDSTWSVKVKFPTGGKWRVISDFTLENEEGAKQNYILGERLEVSGDFVRSELPEPTDSLTVNGYELKVSGSIKTGDHGMLMITVQKDGKPAKLEPYMGALGHLVAIRAEDGAYAHFHPHESAMESMLHFMTEVPGPGKYRLFLQFKVDGVINLAALTADVI
ncbi:MAG: hypothetical protein ACKOW9_03510 [Candidatus Paceibacterota bacterium]